jgi:Icc protein
LTDPSRELVLLQISDVHLRSAPGEKLLGVDTWDSVQAVLDQALAERAPDAVLVTGDVAHDPQPEVYARFREMLAERVPSPSLILPGNHDVLMAMGECGGQLDVGGWRVVAMDSHVDDEPAAEVDEAEVVRLKAACAAAEERHILVATHHPPVPVDCPWLDKDRIQNGPELIEWLAEHTTVRGIVFGHAHQTIETGLHGITLLGAPSTCFQFEPRSERFAVDGLKPGYRWLFLSPEGSIRSEVRRVEDYPLDIDLSGFR